MPPAQGHRYNPAKLLLDPYARAISGTMEWSDALSGYPLRSADPDRDLIPDPQDSAGGMPKSLVVDSAFTWGDDAVAANSLGPDADLRVPRQGHDHAASGRSRCTCGAPIWDSPTTRSSAT